MQADVPGCMMAMFTWWLCAHGGGMQGWIAYVQDALRMTAAEREAPLLGILQASQTLSSQQVDKVGREGL